MTTALENVSRSASARLASRLTRRTMLGRIGKTAMAVSMGGTATALLTAAPAHACTSGLSVKCANLPGWMNNNCPNDTCRCGYWTAGNCANGCNRKIIDCCGGCGGGCRCIGNKRTCCNNKVHSGGCGSSTSKIKCSITRCANCHSAAFVDLPDNIDEAIEDVISQGDLEAYKDTIDSVRPHR